jgi:hypothetical protein
VYPTDDYFTGIFTTEYTLGVTTGVYELYYTMCCRISTLLNSNNDRSANLFAVQAPLECCSPRTSGLPRFYFEKNQPGNFKVTSASPQNYVQTFRISTQSESALLTIAPTGSPALTLNAATGFITWTPTVSGLYAWQVMIDDGKSRVPLDVIFQVLDVCDPVACACVCPKPPFFIPATPVDQIFYRGVQKSFLLQSSNVNQGTTTSISNSPLPTGATFIFQSAVGPTSSYYLTWQPDLSQPLFVVCF